MGGGGGGLSYVLLLVRDGEEEKTLPEGIEKLSHNSIYKAMGYWLTKWNWFQKRGFKVIDLIDYNTFVAVLSFALEL